MDASQKQINFIRSLQDEYAYLIGGDKPSLDDLAAREDIKQLAKEYALADAKEAGAMPQQRREAGHPISDEERKAYFASQREAVAEWVRKLAENELARWDARQAALVADVDGLSMEEASKMIDALSLAVGAIR